MIKVFRGASLVSAYAAGLIMQGCGTYLVGTTWGNEAAVVVGLFSVVVLVGGLCLASINADALRAG